MSAAQLQIILSSPESFAGLIGQTLSIDNATRQSAEDLYAQLRKQRPDACATSLLHLLKSSVDPNVRATCAVFLRKSVGAGSKSAGWQQLNKTTKTAVKRDLLAALAGEVDRNVARQLADTVVELGQQLLDSGEGAAGSKQPAQLGWADLLESLQGWLTAGAAVTREAALQVVAGLAPRLCPRSGQLAPMVGSCLSPQHGPEVNVAALRAAAAFLEYLRKPRELRPFQPALAAGLAALQAALAAGNPGAVELLLEALIRTAEAEPSLWQPHLRTAVSGMLTLAGHGPTGQPLSEELRRLAAEFVLTLVERKPQMVQEELGAGPLASQLVSCLALFLTAGIQDEPSWGADPMAPPDMDEDETLDELHRYGLECGLRAADQLDSGAMLRAVVDMSAAWARDGGDWRRRHAVLLFLSQVVGSCKEEVGPAELGSLAGLLSEGLRDPHPRVRWAACHAVGVLSDDLGPRLQLQAGGGGAALLRGLTDLLAEPRGPASPERVKAQGCRALVGFLEGLDKEEEEKEAEGAVALLSKDQLLLPLLQPLCASLLGHVERCAAGEGGAVPGGRALVPTPVQECSMDVLTRLAVALGPSFAPVYPAAMPPVLAVLARAAPFHGPSAVASGAVTEEEATAIVRVQVGALDCVAFMSRAAGPAATAPHLPTLAAQLGLLARPDLEPSSQLVVPLLGAIEPLASCLGAEARHLMGPALPLLVQWAVRDVGLQPVDEDDDDEAEEEEEAEAGKASDGSDDDSEADEQDDSDLAFVSYGGVSYRCSATVLAAKSAAVSSLEELVDKMGPAIAQQAAQVADALVPRLRDYVLDEVHANARRAVPKLLRNYLAALTHGSLPPTDPAASPAASQALLERIWRTTTAVITAGAGGEEAEGGAAVEEGAVAGVPLPTTSTRADMVQVLASIVEAVEGTMLQEAWVAGAFAALQAAVAAAQREAHQEDSSDDEEEDKSMEADGSVDLEGEGSGAEEEDEDDGEETEDGGESPEAARERLRAQVEACVSSFTRKYGDAVAPLVQRVLAAQQQQGMEVAAVRNGVVA